MVECSLHTLCDLVIRQTPGHARIGRPGPVPAGWVLQLVDGREVGHAQGEDGSSRYMA